MKRTLMLVAALLTTAHAQTWTATDNTQIAYMQREGGKSINYVTWLSQVALGDEFAYHSSLQRDTSSIYGSCNNYRYLGILQGSIVLGVTQKSVSLSSKDFAYGVFKDFQPDMKSSKNSKEGVQAQVLCLLYGKTDNSFTTYLPLTSEGFEVVSPANGLRFNVKPDAWGLQVTPIGVK